MPFLERLFPGLSVSVERNEEKPIEFFHQGVALDGARVLSVNFSHALRTLRGKHAETLWITCQFSGGVSIKETPKGAPIEITEGNCSVLWAREGGALSISQYASRHLVNLPREVLESVVRRHFDIEVYTRPEFEAPIISARHPANARIRQLIQMALQPPLIDCGPYSETLARQLRDLIVTTVLLGVPNTLSKALCKASTPAPSRHIRRALEFMEANLENPITIDMIANAAGCTPRGLQVGFREHFGTTPLGALKKRRLEEAEKRLRSGRYGTVMEVAYSLSFGNPGRFAGEFSAKFGIPPAKLLRSA